jgi:hypothetical protein
MYAKARRRAEKRPVEDTARYRPNDIRVIGAHADYRREDFIFPRTQSPQLRELEWESRAKPLKPWVPNFAANLAFAIFA